MQLKKILIKKKCITVQICNGRCLYNRLINSFYENPVSGWNTVHLYLVSGLVDPEPTHAEITTVLLVEDSVVFSQKADLK